MWDCDLPLFARTRRLRGRRDYRCVECRQIIPPKTTTHLYVEWATADLLREGRLDVKRIRVCEGCQQDWEDFMDATVCEFVAYGFLKEHIADSLHCGELKLDDRLVRSWLPELFVLPRLTLADGQLELALEAA